MNVPLSPSIPATWLAIAVSCAPTGTVLQPGMTFHFMPGLWMEGWGLETTESIVIRDGAPEVLGSVPRQLFVKD
ncbi:hypothetical protein STA1M1_23150 [Sinisalibacter aestuarii]|uniref:M24 family metallopeptidase n=1 Tax=Sinisalibacter aestuarii TaxID=2949426 RepID=A0ABQ5LVR0_9RHOB|nr:hypothetical protein STA1M1_23150 [Sinisalibacter aestuarii]